MRRHTKSIRKFKKRCFLINLKHTESIKEIPVFIICEKHVSFPSLSKVIEIATKNTEYKEDKFLCSYIFEFKNSIDFRNAIK